MARLWPCIVVSPRRPMFEVCMFVWCLCFVSLVWTRAIMAHLHPYIWINIPTILCSSSLVAPVHMNYYPKSSQLPILVQSSAHVHADMSYVHKFPRGVHSLLYFAYTCVRDLFIKGVNYLAKKIIRWWYSTCKKPENILCDGILHVNIFHYFKIPYIICTFATKFNYNEYFRPYFLSHVVSTIFTSDPPPQVLKTPYHVMLWDYIYIYIFFHTYVCSLFIPKKLTLKYLISWKTSIVQHLKLKCHIMQNVTFE